MLKTLRNVVQRVFNEDTRYGDVIRVQTGASQLGFFKTVTRAASAGTSTIVEPISSDTSILLTDLIITTDKVNATSATVRFTDGTDTVVIMTADATNAPITTAISFAGTWQGWAGARLELVTVGAITATACCGYMKIDKKYTVQSYDTWNALR